MGVVSYTLHSSWIRAVPKLDTRVERVANGVGPAAHIIESQHVNKNVGHRH